MVLRLDAYPCMAMAKPMTEISQTPDSAQDLASDLRALIQDARGQAAVAVNASLTLLYWQLGDRIRREVLGNTRAAYREEILVTASRDLTGEFGRGYSEKNLRRMIQFAEAFPEEIVATLSRQLSWSHFSAPSLSNASSVQKWHAWRAGASEHCAIAWIPCSMSGLPCQESLNL